MGFIFLTLSHLALLFLPTISASNVCLKVPGTPADKVTLCGCYNSYYGVDRAHMLDALDLFCRNVRGSTFGADRTTYAIYTLDYPAQPLTGEEGVITVQLTWTGGDAPECKGHYDLTYERCWEGFHVPVDGCNTSSENGKQGGYGTNACMEWRVDPNPKQNEPTVAMPTRK